MPKAKLGRVPGSFLAVADVHFDKKLFNLPELEEDLRQDFLKAVNKCIELNVSYFIVVGDMYEDNKPTAETVLFVSEQVAKLKKAGITALAIAGDHDKPIDGKNWVIHTNGFKPINDAPTMIGVDYNDSPEIVMAELTKVWEEKVGMGFQPKFVFLHGHIRELWPFCQEKKLLDIRGWLEKHAVPDLRGVILGDIHKPFEDHLTLLTTNQKYYMGYCGSLGVTRIDEVLKKGYLHYDGEILHRVTYTLEREFIEIPFTHEWINALNEIEKNTIISKCKERAKRPVVILNYTDGSVESRLGEIAFLYEHAIVKRNRTSKTEEGATINMRSEIKNDDKIEAALGKVDVLKDARARELALNVLRNPDDIKSILDKFKEEALK